MKNFNDLRNAINARIDAIQNTLTQKESEQLIIQEIIYTHKNKVRNRGFIREVFEKRVEIVNSAIKILRETDVSQLNIEQHASLLKEYHNHLDWMVMSFYEDAKEYIKKYNHLIDNGTKVEITTEKRKLILLNIKTELDLLKSKYMHFNLPNNIPELEAWGKSRAIVKSCV